MRVVVVGATGNIGSAVLAALAMDPQVTDIVGVCRRPPSQPAAKTSYVAADISTDDLSAHFSGADAVVHLGWIFQPTHDPVTTWRVNVGGSARVFAAAEAAGVSALVYSSSVGAYSPRNGTEYVDESWPTHSSPTSGYGREKAYVERLLDAVEERQPSMRVVRLRPAFVFQRAAATQQRRLFAGPLLPGWLTRPGRLPVLPYPAGLRFQALHASDAADAFRRAVLRDVRGAFNVAAGPVIDAQVVAEVLKTRTVEVPGRLVRAALNGAWRLHLVPAEPALLDLVLGLPLMRTERAHTQLGWQPTRSSRDALRELVLGLADGSGAPTPPLAPDSAGGRLREVATGVGARNA